MPMVVFLHASIAFGSASRHGMGVVATMDFCYASEQLSCNSRPCSWNLSWQWYLNILDLAHDLGLGPASEVGVWTCLELLLGIGLDRCPICSQLVAIHCRGHVAGHGSVFTLVMLLGRQGWSVPELPFSGCESPMWVTLSLLHMACTCSSCSCCYSRHRSSLLRWCSLLFRPSPNSVLDISQSLSWVYVPLWLWTSLPTIVMEKIADASEHRLDMLPIVVVGLPGHGLGQPRAEADHSYGHVLEYRVWSGVASDHLASECRPCCSPSVAP